MRVLKSWSCRRTHKLFDSGPDDRSLSGSNHKTFGEITNEDSDLWRNSHEYANGNSQAECFKMHHFRNSDWLRPHNERPCRYRFRSVRCKPRESATRLLARRLEDRSCGVFRKCSQYSDLIPR